MGTQRYNIIPIALVITYFAISSISILITSIMIYTLTTQVFVLCLLVNVLQNARAFTCTFPGRNSVAFASKSTTSMNAEKAAMEVTGAELEVMLTEWDQPLLLDAYGRYLTLSLTCYRIPCLFILISNYEL
jgi:hypothetical protein